MYLIEGVLLSVIGRINQALFWVSRGRVLIYRFHGRSGLLLMVTGPGTPVGETELVGYLSDGDDYIVMASDREPIAEARWTSRLRTATHAVVEITEGRRFAVDITMLIDSPERGGLLNRLLKNASLNERHDIKKHRELQIARLTPCQRQPAQGGSEAFSGVGLR